MLKMKIFSNKICDDLRSDDFKINQGFTNQQTKVELEMKVTGNCIWAL